MGRRRPPAPVWPRQILVSTGLAVVVAGCRDAPPAGVEDLRIVDPLEYHAREGFVRLVPPVHLPSSSADRDQVEIWVKVPADATIAVDLTEPDRPMLTFPPGTWADRVEYAGTGDERHIADIRGTRIDDDGSQTFYVLRPSAPRPSAELFGVRWAREDAAAHQAATERLVAEVARHPPVDAMPAAHRDRILDGVRTRNGCAGCHVLSRPPNTRPHEHGLVDRGTDHSGFFTPQTLLWEQTPLERYGAHDRSWNDSAIEVRCGAQVVQREDRGCPDGSIPWGRLRWDAVEPEARAHLSAVCDGRRWLLAHVDREAASSLTTGMRHCAEN